MHRGGNYGEIKTFNADIKLLLSEKNQNLDYPFSYKNKEIGQFIDFSTVKGCMIIRPYGYAIWENIQKYLDNKIKEVAGLTSRCIPFEQEDIDTKCVCCGKTAEKMVYWGKAY